MIIHHINELDLIRRQWTLIRLRWKHCCWETPKRSKGSKEATVKELSFIDRAYLIKEGETSGNNNATPVNSPGRRKTKGSMSAPRSKYLNDQVKEMTARSDPNVVDESVVDPRLHDGVDVHVEGIDSEYEVESESEVDEEVNFRPDVDNVLTDSQGDDDQQDGGTDMVLGDTSSDFGNAMNDVRLKKMFDIMMDEKLKQAKNDWLAEQQGEGRNKGGSNVRRKEVNSHKVVKSPSDTTIYRPAIRRQDQEHILSVPRNEPINMGDQIANFVAGIRLQETTPQRERDPEMVQPGTSANADAGEAYTAAKRRSENTILEAEKYKEMIAEPPGECRDPLIMNVNAATNTPMLVQNIGTGLSDDDFFHLTCHIEPSLVAKIEKGEFVQLDKLLTKEKKHASEDNRMEWIHSEGSTFLAPVADRANRITNFRRWEQAFRVYATIYCGANPSRSREIWQYVSVISTASSSYQWDNVYEYDTTFRHLMAFNPSRSWAVTYNQMWNLCMKDPLQPRGSFPPRQGGSNNGGFFQKGQTNEKKRKPKYCWNFNRGEVCKFGKKCRFIERCSFCDASSHGINACTKFIAKGDKAEKQ